MKILIGTSVRQDEDVFKMYLESLDRLIVPDGVKVDKYFVLHNSENLSPLLKEKGISHSLAKGEEEYVKDETTHHWKESLIQQISEIKNHIIDVARKGSYDYLFFVDSDLILHPKTLWHLISGHQDITGNIFWTKWDPEEEEAPNCWDFNTYGFIGQSPQERWNMFKAPGLYQCGGTGACILLSKKVLTYPHINYNRVYNVDFWGEDRYFCIRAASHDIPIFIDTQYPAKHLYRRSEVEDYIKGGGYDGLWKEEG